MRGAAERWLTQAMVRYQQMVQRARETREKKETERDGVRDKRGNWKVWKV